MMSEVPISVASAVLPPEPQQIGGAPSPSLKRRQSSEPFSEQKRQRISEDGATIDNDEPAPSPPQSRLPDRLNDRRRTGQLEERKRGQRLFGALLGTLSQSSSSTANKRRADIEDKQRTKLKVQTEEENERRKARLDELIVQRRQEQKVFDEISLKRRHQNMLAQAHFLRTKAEPKLYYKPWELLSSEETIIESQIEEVKELVDGELRDYEVSQGRNPEQHPQRRQEEATDIPQIDADMKDADGKATDSGDPVEQGVNGTNEHDASMGEATAEASTIQKPKDNQDDGGEVVEGDEDTVIY